MRNNLGTTTTITPDRFQMVTMYDERGNALRTIEHDCERWELHWIEPMVEWFEVPGPRHRYRRLEKREFTRHAVYHLEAMLVVSELTRDVEYQLRFKYWF